MRVEVEHAELTLKDMEQIQLVLPGDGKSIPQTKFSRAWWKGIIER